MSQFSNYALWFNLKRNRKKKIINGLREMYDNMMNIYQLDPDVRFDFEDMFLKIGDDFYLIRIEEHWSPGDISGMFSHVYLDKDEQIMAVLISRDYYLPYHGINSVTPSQLSDWHSFPDKYKLVKINNDRY